MVVRVAVPAVDADGLVAPLSGSDGALEAQLRAALSESTSGSQSVRDNVRIFKNRQPKWNEESKMYLGGWVRTLAARRIAAGEGEGAQDHGKQGGGTGCARAHSGESSLVVSR